MSGSTSNNNYVGSGSDTITLSMSEDQAVGTDAQFTVNVDGQQIGGLQTVTASHAAGQDQSFTFAGDYGPGPHNVTVTFDNNFIYPGVGGDRNLYVDGVNYDGQTISNSTTPIYESPFFPPNSTEGNVYGNAVYTVNDTTAIPAGASPQPSTTPGAVAVGTGPDNLVLNMAEDAYLGDAQFTVSVDGQQIGGTQTTTAIVEQGQQQEFDVHGNFGPGNHTVSVNFLNDQIGGFYPGTQWAIDTTDRNLYVMGMSLNGGAAASGTPWELSSDGSFSWTVSAGSNPSAPDTMPASGTPDTAAVTSGSLTSTTGMSFVASPSTSATSGPATNAIAPSTSAADATPAVSGATQTAQDFTIPTTTGSTGADTTGATGGSGATWWMNHQMANAGGTAFHQHG
jgi:hypothetical protein